MRIRQALKRAPLSSLASSLLPRGPFTTRTTLQQGLPSLLPNHRSKGFYCGMISPNKNSCVPPASYVPASTVPPAVPTFVSPLKPAPGTFNEEVAKWPSDLDITEAPTPPSSWYTSPDFLKKEAKAIFHSGWQQVGRVEQVVQRGSYFTGEVLGEPYVVVRDDEGELHAFFNVCRHHAARVAVGNGCAEALVCPYHGWTYRLDGKLKMAPRVGGIQNFKARDHGLKPMAVTTWGRWIFVNVDSSALWKPSEEFKELETILDKTHYQDLTFGMRKTYYLDCNWKVYVDNYLDGGYHVEQLHHSLDAQLNTKEYKTDLFGRVSVQSCPGVTTDAGKTNKTHESLRDRVGNHGAYYAFVYPNFMINRYGNMMDTNLVLPLSVDKTLVHFDYFYDPKKVDISQHGTDKHSHEAKEEGHHNIPRWLKESINISDQIQDEDAWVSESVQKGLSSSAYVTGRYAPKVEMAAYHFHQLLAQDFRTVLD